MDHSSTCGYLREFDWREMLIVGCIAQSRSSFPDDVVKRRKREQFARLHV